MFFSKRTKKSFEIMKEKNRRYLDSMKDKDAAAPDPETGIEGIEESEEAEERLEELTEAGSTGEAGERLAEEELWGELREASAGETEETPPEDDEEDDEEDDDFPKTEKNLEKGDLPAMIISAFLVFGPIFLALAGILALAWIFLH